ncbi:MAG: 16S rRNA (guanine(527)-N(7))-methyltransferase RsmG [Bacteroidia bacterium]|nr:16S rRNA (guanine(527)-N(7))-methyltransferase RsmG [Bacteroidota bacterium]MBK7431167.1 16S rRNA (guanine(527)-N(7))-methyltransferase RsmG [Bacteroidota bacterium]MBK8585047.1 16S rRNA (guanine(527)-N(7))-methyltransferase RsmG [Bacteroidota bacterium]MBP9923937.1 16S rRNA (guanine(527)-N(7))-methyltransferase RsmG [Bacteroidia bacterium]
MIAVLVQSHFPNLTAKQESQFAQLKDLYEYWNERVNVISRQDIKKIYLHHVLHSLAIAKLITFKPGTSVLDIGTGGGFPGIPLAILFPEVRFYLVDSIGKKIAVVNEVVKAIGLTNVSTEKARAEELNMKVDFVVSRAVAPVKDIVHWSSKLIKKGGTNDLQNGWILLKGGDLTEEIEQSGKTADVFEVSDWFKDEFFETKKVVYITA